MTSDAQYARDQAELARKHKIMLARIEPLEEGVDLGRYLFEASIAVSLKRIADALDRIAGGRNNGR